MHMTRGNVIIQNVCLKISLGLFKTLLKDLSLNKEKKELQIHISSLFERRERHLIFFLTKQTLLSARKINLIQGQIDSL